MKTLLTLFSISLGMLVAQGQQIEVSGIVIDETNSPFPGVNVLVKGTENETQTNEEGTYTIATEIGQELEFSRFGYFTQTVIIEDAESINIQMEVDNATVIDAIVGGFNKKRKQGYSVATICGSEIADNPQKDFSRALEGKTAGVIVKPQTGYAGSTNTVIIRGLNSFNGSNHPLYVIDGVPYDTRITYPGNVICGDNGSNRSFDIDPNNIASVKILKGLAATNIYGSEGRNGVVIITTKAGPYANR
ncbi:TonB-dependent receptor plug domain-containing protein [Aureisphaera galaxeae]|uniref:TonB-dependent receptor plug domain-containing protein n=1 Tax=Aureisphaera galaxeae TaxID=1538023 RepID=UPI002350A5A4|nr:TonB-dependent receptor plug domain-containing protein [Aureisphaera galaxeae]MDC8004874.1 TonB-dependent receptor plug domain-containing protein [Aureisphaera galaxeae]